MIDAYTRLNQHMQAQAKKVQPDSIIFGKIVDPKKMTVKVGGNIVPLKEYKMLLHEVDITDSGGKKHKFFSYYGDKQELKIEYDHGTGETVKSVTVSVPPLKKGDIILLTKYDGDDGEYYVILGKVVGWNVFK